MILTVSSVTLAATPDGARRAPPRALGLVHAFVGPRQQFVDLAEFVTSDHQAAEAHRERAGLTELLAFRPHGALKACFDCLKVEALVVAAPEYCERDELVAPKARKYVFLAKGEAECVAGGDEHSIAGRMAHLVVHALETVDVQVHDEDLRTVTSRSPARLADQGEEASPIEQAGKFVAIGQIAQEALQLLVDGDASADRQAEPARADLDQTRAHFDRQSPPIAGDVHGLKHEAAGFAESLRALLHVAPGFGRVDVLGGHRQQLLTRVAQRPAGRLVDLHELAWPPIALEAVDQDGVAAGVEQGPVAALALELLEVGRVQRADRQLQGVALREDGERDQREKEHAQDALHGRRHDPLCEGDARRTSHQDELGPALHRLPRSLGPVMLRLMSRPLRARSRVCLLT